MRFKWIGAVALLLLFLLSAFCGAWAQSIPTVNASMHETSLGNRQPEQVLVVPPQLTDFERYASRTDQALVSLSFPQTSTDLADGLALTLTPRALTSLDAPNSRNAPELLAVEFHLSQSLPSTSTGGLPRRRSILTLLDFDELPAFQSLFRTLATTGMPQMAYSDVKAVVRMTSKSGMHLEFAREPNGGIQCVIATEADSITFLLDQHSANQWVDAFTAAARTLDSAKESRT